MRIAISLICFQTKVIDKQLKMIVVNCINRLSPIHGVYDLRHTFAVNSIMAGDDIKTLQENMGHYSAAFTLDRYGHVTPTMRRESANRMQAFISNLTTEPG